MAAATTSLGAKLLASLPAAARAGAMNGFVDFEAKARSLVSPANMGLTVGPAQHKVDLKVPGGLQNDRGLEDPASDSGESNGKNVMTLQQPQLLDDAVSYMDEGELLFGRCMYDDMTSPTGGGVRGTEYSHSLTLTMMNRELYANRLVAGYNNPKWIAATFRPRGIVASINGYPRHTHSQYQTQAFTVVVAGNDKILDYSKSYQTNDFVCERSFVAIELRRFVEADMGPKGPPADKIDADGYAAKPHIKVALPLDNKDEPLPTIPVAYRDGVTRPSEKPAVRYLRDRLEGAQLKAENPKAFADAPFWQWVITFQPTASIQTPEEAAECVWMGAPSKHRTIIGRITSTERQTNVPSRPSVLFPGEAGASKKPVLGQMGFLQVLLDFRSTE